MDWGLLNAIGITVMAAIAMWLLNREHKRVARLHEDNQKANRQSQ